MLEFCTDCKRRKLGVSIWCKFVGLTSLVQARVGSVNQVLYGFYNIPTTPDNPIDIVINPVGDAARSERRRDVILKIVTLAALLQQSVP